MVHPVAIIRNTWSSRVERLSCGAGFSPPPRVAASFSASQAVTALLKQESWSDDELDALRKQIDAVRKNRRK